MTRVDGTEPKTCEYCGQSTEEFTYLLNHPRRCKGMAKPEPGQVLSVEEFGQLLNDTGFNIEKDQYAETFRLVSAAVARERERTAQVADEMVKAAHDRAQQNQSVSCCCGHGIADRIRGTKP